MVIYNFIMNAALTISFKIIKLVLLLLIALFIANSLK